MNCLLDPCALLWLADNRAQLPEPFREARSQPGGQP